LDFGIWDFSLKLRRRQVQKRGVGRVPFVQLSAPIYSVIAYRSIYLVAVEVDARLGPVVIGGW